VLDAGEREQRRLGSELHDGLGQELVAAELLLAALVRASERVAPELLPAISEIRKVLGQAGATARRIAQGLGPIDLERSGLLAALDKLAVRSSANFGITVQADIEPNSAVARDPSRDAHLYRIAQEAISNAVRHGRASHVEISVRLDPGLTLEVRDNGIGFDTTGSLPDSGMGLRLMQYRAALIGARIVANSSPSGTTITCYCPDDRVGSANFVSAL
jgi:signal transduction histidine kinase